jgi:hypothetical protein
VAKVKAKAPKSGRRRVGQLTQAGAAQQASRPARQQEALGLRRDGYSYSEIAAAMACSISTAHGLVQEALAELRALVAQEAEAVREVEDARLDLIVRRLVETVRGGTPDQATRAAQALVRASESRRRLWGVDLGRAQEEPPADATIIIGGEPDP